MVLYESTRGVGRPYQFSECVLKGIASDGGLFVPKKFSEFTLEQLRDLSGKSYQDQAIFLFDLFETDFSLQRLRNIVNEAYSTNFDHPDIAPLVKLKDKQYMLEHWHGPTSAFKDMALQIMPLFFSEAVKMDNEKRERKGELPLKYLILVATSGDTGKAALEGFKDKENTSIIVFYPFDGVSTLQELSMTTSEGENVAVFGMLGDFDDTQRCVKEVFSDQEFNQKLLEEYGFVLSSANSINWGRVLPQIVYYASSYIDLVGQGAINLGDEIDIAVPTGNFGNILSAFYAKKMGLPVRRLICASNENNVLTDFLQTGVYDVSKRELVKTPSPSMDIIVASNIERLLYEITRNYRKVSEWMRQLKEEGKFAVDGETLETLQTIFYADWVSNEDCLTTIGKIYKETGYLMDPHTAVAQAVVERYNREQLSDVPVVICSTAHWAKFPRDVYRALIGLQGDESDLAQLNVLDDFDILSKIQDLAQSVTVPRGLSELKHKKVRHKGECSVGKEAVECVIFQYLKDKQARYL